MTTMHIKFVATLLLLALPGAAFAQALPANLAAPASATPVPPPPLPGAIPNVIPSENKLEIRNSSSASTGGSLSVGNAGSQTASSNCIDQTGLRQPLPPAKLGTYQASEGSMPPAQLGKKVIANRNEFQELVYITLNQDLPLYGYNFFQCVPSTFTAVDQVPILSNYVIGPGDQIFLRGWGQIDVDYNAYVDRGGNFYLPKVGTIYVAGLKFGELTGYLKSVLSKTYRNFELNVSLGALRSIPIYVVGQATRPGNYTVSALTTLVNAIFVAGGPSRQGSMRGVQLRRNGRVIGEFDLYNLLLRGDTSRDLGLQAGDVIYFPTIGPLVAIGGSVNTAAIFELKATKRQGTPAIAPLPQDALLEVGQAMSVQQSQGRTTLKDLLGFAGGLSTTASNQQVTLERIEGRSVRRVDEFDFDSTTLNRAVQDGDVVIVAPISLKFDNAVTLRGNVARPARYPWRPGMRVSDLISSPDDLIPKTFYAGRNLLGLEEAPNQQIKPEGNEINWDYAAIERIEKPDLTTRLLTFNLGLAVRQRDPVQNLLLQPGDVVSVYSKSEVRVPQNKQRRYVRLEGEFNYPGVYQALPNETLRQLVARVGGLTPNAYLYGASFYRESVRATQQRGLDEAAAKLEAQITTTAGEGPRRTEDADKFNARINSQRQLVGQLRTTKAAGRLVFNSPQLIKRGEDLPDLPLEDGDGLVIPFQVNVVTVAGQVYNQNAFIHQSGESVGYYLNRAGGITKSADYDSAYIIKADGSVLSRRQTNIPGGFLGIGAANTFESIRLMPGDAVVVPEQLTTYDGVAELKDISQIIFSFAVAAGSLATIFNRR